MAEVPDTRTHPSLDPSTLDGVVANPMVGDCQDPGVIGDVVAGGSRLLTESLMMIRLLVRQAVK